MYRKRASFLALAGLVTLCFVLIGTSQVVAKTKISIWGGDPQVHKFLIEAAKSYGKLHPDIQVTPTLFPVRALQEKMAATIPAGEGGDLINDNCFGLYPYYASGYIAELPDDVAAWFKENYPKPAINLGRVPGTDKLFSVAFLNGAKVMYYNKDHFKEAGLGQPPQDIYEQIMYAMKLTKYDAAGNPTRVGLDLRLSGGSFGTAQKYWGQAMIPYETRPVQAVKDGKTLTQEEWEQYPAASLKWQAAYDNEAGRSALKYYIDAVHKYKCESFDVKSDCEGFGLGLGSMLQRESFVIGYMSEHAPEINYDVFLMPKGPGAWASLCQTVGLSSPKASKHQKEIWDFAKFLVNDENTIKLALDTGWLGYRINLDLSPLFKEIPLAKVFLVDSIQTPGYGTVTYPKLAANMEIHIRLAEQLMVAFKRADLVDNPEGIAKVIHAMAKETNRILDEYDLLAK